MSYKNILKKIGTFQVRHPYLTVLIIIAITVALYGGVGQVKTVASLEQMMPADVKEIEAFNTLRDNQLGQDMIAVIITIDEEIAINNPIMDVREQEVMDYAARIKEALQTETDIITTYAASDVITYATGKAPGKLDEETYRKTMQQPQVQQQLSNFINEDKNTMIILATTDVSADDRRMNQLATQLIYKTEQLPRPAGTKLQITGTPLIQQKLGELIGKDRKNTQWISTLFVFIIIILLFGTFTSALVPLAIVTLSVNWLYGIMGYTNIPISTLAGGVAAMVIGIGIDYSIHLMNRFKNERKNGKNKEEAIIEAIQNTGTALTGAAIATILAFLAFLIGDMPEMNRFGLLMAIGVSSAFILSIIGLPALLVIEEKIIHLLARRMHFGVEGEYMLCEHDDVHPDNYKETSPSDEELKTIRKHYKIVRKKK